MWYNESMTTVYAKIIGDEAVVPKSEFDRLVEIARRSEEIDLQTDDIPAAGIMHLAQSGGSFDHVAEDSDVYSVEDLKVRYK